MPLVRSDRYAFRVADELLPNAPRANAPRANAHDEAEHNQHDREGPGAQIARVVNATVDVEQ